MAKSFRQTVAELLREESGGITLTTTLSGGGGDLGPDTGGFTIQETTQSLVVAPAPVWLEAQNPTGFRDESNVAISEPATDGDYDDTFHKITYIWIVEEETSPGTWTQLTGSYPRVVNMVTAWNQAYVAYGKRVAFRLPDPGTYRFRCWAVDMQGNTGLVTSSTITVQDPDVAFSAADTIIYAGDGVFTGAPAGNTQVSSMAALNTAIQGRSNPTRIRFKPGETVSGNLDIVGGSRAEYHDTWTAGQKVTRRGPMNNRTLEQMYTLHTAMPQVQTSWVDHIFEGDWDETTETGDSGMNLVFESRFTNSLYRNIIYNCDITGLTSCNMAGSLDSGDRRWMVADMVVTSWKSYGFYLERNTHGHYAFLGSTVARNPQALSGPNTTIGKENLHNDHGALRVASAANIYMGCCDWFNNAGWSPGGPGNLPTANACMRLFSFPNGTPHSLVVDRNVAEGGFVTWKMDGQDASATKQPGNYLFDKILTLVTARAQFVWATGMGGTTRRNCYTWAPNIPYYDGQGFPIRHENALADGVYGIPDPDNFTYPMLEYCNTFFGLPDDGVISETDGGESNWGVLYQRENYINHQPLEGVTTFAPINTDPATEAVPGVTPRTTGVRWNYQPVTVTGVSVPDGGTLSIPYSDFDSDNGNGDGNTSPTNQAYWQALPGSDDQHMVRILNDEALPYQAARGELSISYADPTNMVITNTSGNTWTGTALVQPDRKSRLATDLPELTQYASPSQVPMPRPQAGSSALVAVGAGELRPHDDFAAPGVAGVSNTRTTAGAVEAV